MFNIILSLVTLITGIVWLADRAWLARRRVEQEGAEVRASWFVDFCTSLFPVIFAVFVLRSFLVEPFRIPSGSMIPTLHIGDFILVNKYAYGLRCPVGSCELLHLGEPKRGDVVVFRFPGMNDEDPQKGVDFIKRVIGVPGDHVVYSKKMLTVNNVAVPLQADGTYLHGGYYNKFTEDLLGVRHTVILNPDVEPHDVDFVVPAQSYFMMGDNRDGSFDSRFWGPVPEANLRGKAFFIWMSWDSDRFRPDFSRLGLVIH